MTIKQKFFLNKYLEFGNATQAAFCAYNTQKRNVAAQIGYENLRKHDVKQAIQGHFERIDRVPFYVAESFVDILKNGTVSQRLNASIAYFKIMGLYPCPHNSNN